ncbi:glycoside hydrolase family 28 protein [Streptomyces sp. NPDC014889]|uniref:glycoside hydrolase family 28 protein n=1 Tax=Streptomyces sp. NPDC014889 TaxID=3364928 RepID=UPI0036FA2E98
MSEHRGRRDFLKAGGFALGSALVAGAVLRQGTAYAAAGTPLAEPAATSPSWTPKEEKAWDQAWKNIEKLRHTIKAPHFPNRKFHITDFGAIGDGTSDNTEAFRRAIAECHRRNGGHVVVSAGVWLTGPIHLLSNVDLHLEAGSTVRFTQDVDAYKPLVLTRFEGMEFYNYSPLVYAYGQRNIAITGSGVLDGQGDNSHWWPWKGKAEYGWNKGDPKQDNARNALMAMVEQGVPVEERVFGDGSYMRPMFIQPYRCESVLVEGVTIKDSPMWNIHPVECTDVIIQGVTVTGLGPNNDGCDPESSKNVLIRDCVFATGDDCIAIKAARNAEGRRLNVPSENILIENCEFRDGHGGVTIGSEMTGGVRNVFAQNLRMTSPELQIAIRMKTNSLRGGVIENFNVRNVTVGEVSISAIETNYYYEEADGYPFMPDVHDITIRDLTVQKAPYALSMRAFPNAPIRNVRLRDCTFAEVAKDNVTENVDGLRLDNVLVNGRPAGS